MSKGTKRPYNEVLPIAQRLMEMITPYCDRVEIAGSLRRKREMIGDIEIVALPKRPLNLLGEPVTNIDTYLDVFLQDRFGELMTKAGRKLKSFAFKGHQVDLFLPGSPAHWGSIFMIRTGPHKFNMWVMQTRCKHVGVKFKDGLVYDWHSRLIETPEESDVFQALEMPFVTPEMRDDGKWLEALK